MLKLAHSKLRSAKLSAPRALTLRADGTLGVDNINTILTAVLTLIADLVEVIKNRQYLAAFGVVGQLMAFGNVIQLAEMAWKEIKDLTLEESNLVVAHFAATFDLEDDRAEEMIEYALGLLPRIYAVILNGMGLFGEIQLLVAEIKTVFGSGTPPGTSVTVDSDQPVTDLPPRVFETLERLDFDKLAKYPETAKAKAA